eukprot:9481472-Pyramimonas_sp.AAC.1
MCTFRRTWWRRSRAAMASDPTTAAPPPAPHTHTRASRGDATPLTSPPGLLPWPGLRLSNPPWDVNYLHSSRGLTPDGFLSALDRTFRSPFSSLRSPSRPADIRPSVTIPISAIRPSVTITSPSAHVPTPPRPHFLSDVPAATQHKPPQSFTDSRVRNQPLRPGRTRYNKKCAVLYTPTALLRGSAVHCTTTTTRLDPRQGPESSTDNQGRCRETAATAGASLSGRKSTRKPSLANRPSRTVPREPSLANRPSRTVTYARRYGRLRLLWSSPRRTPPATLGPKCARPPRTPLCA